MVQIEWGRIASIQVEELNEDDKEDLFDIITEYEIETDLTQNRSLSLLRLAQEILRFKGEQVEVLVAELDTVTSKLQKLEKQGLKGSNVQNLKEQCYKYEEEIEKLKTELKNQDRGSLDRKRELKELRKKVTILEEEKSELQRELSFLPNDGNVDGFSKESLQVYIDKQQEMAEVIKQKNKHINELLEDFEVLEKENKILQKKLSSLRDKLAEATEHLTQLTAETSGYRQTCSEQADKISLLEEQNVSLQAQIKELVELKRQRDTQLDELSDALDSRIQEWKKLMERKDTEILELKEKLTYFAAQSPDAKIDPGRNSIAFLTMTLQQQEEQIDNLQKQLLEATKEINESAAVIEDLRCQKSTGSQELTPDENIIQQLRLQLESSEKKVNLLEESLRNIEEDAKLKDEEAALLAVRIRSLESGELGLAQALQELDKVHLQLSVRDAHIEQLVVQLNDLQSLADNLEDQNITLRDKLGLSATDSVDTSVAREARSHDKATSKRLQEQLEQMEEHKIQLQTENHRLLRQISKLSRKFGFDADTLSLKDEDGLSLLLQDKKSVLSPRKVKSKCKNSNDNEQLNNDDHKTSKRKKEANSSSEKIEMLTEENEALRKGMHEILESIQQQQGSGVVRVESHSLEQLLRALDARHVSGWYHPAMRLHAELNASQGANAILRDQLHALRTEDRKNCSDLQKALIALEELQRRFTSFKQSETGDSLPLLEKRFVFKLPLTTAEVIDYLNVLLLQVSHEIGIQEEILPHSAQAPENVSELVMNESGFTDLKCQERESSESEDKTSGPGLFNAFSKAKWNDEGSIRVRHEISQLRLHEEITAHRISSLQQPLETDVLLSALKIMWGLLKKFSSAKQNNIDGGISNVVNECVSEDPQTCDTDEKKAGSTLCPSNDEMAERVTSYTGLEADSEELLSSVFNGEYRKLTLRLSDAEDVILNLRSEKEMLLEKLELLEKTLSDMKLKQEIDNNRYDKLLQLSSVMQHGSDDKITIVRLEQDLLTAHENLKSIENIMQQQNSEITKLQLMNMETLKKLNEKEDLLYQLRNDLHSSFLEDIKQILKISSFNSKPVDSKRLPDIPLNTSVKPVPLPRKHTPEINVLQEKVDKLETHCKQLEASVEDQAQYIKTLESKRESSEKNWTEAKSEWEQKETALRKQLIDVDTKQKTLSIERSVADAEVQFSESTINAEPCKNEMKNTSTQTSEEETESSTVLSSADRAEIDALKEKIVLLEKKVQQHNCDTTENYALQEAMETMKTIVVQKDETICQYQKMLQENREEFSEQEQKLRKEIKDLQNAMVIHSQIHNRLKHKARSLLVQARNNAADANNRQIQQLQTELTELRAQLAAVQATAQQNTSDEKQSLHEEEGTLKKELLNAVERLINQMEAAKRDPALSKCITLLKAQDSKQEVLTKTVYELETDIKLLAEALTHEVTIAMPVEKEKVPAIQSAVERQRASRKLQQELKLRDIREEELQKKISFLEKELQEVKQQQEKEKEMIIESKVKVARWDEKKKWQQQVEKLRKQLEESKEAARKLEKCNMGLRFTITRLEREKNLLLGRLSVVKEERLKPAISA